MSWIFRKVKLHRNMCLFRNYYDIKFFQDEFGNTQYGYSNLNSAKHEVGNGFTGVSGSYQYVDANGKLQTVNYVADALGFRVEDTRLPVAPVYDGVAPEAPVYDGVAPEPVQDTPEVVAAREAHLAAFEEVASRYVQTCEGKSGLRTVVVFVGVFSHCLSSV